MNLYSENLKLIKSIIIDLYPELKNIEIINKIVVEPPKIEKYGDMSSNGALIIGSFLKINPLIVAQRIKDKMTSHSAFENIVLMKPGFINFNLKKNVWQSLLVKVSKNKDGWKYDNIGKGENLNIEFVSANPTGPLHAGHARGAVFGDTLANILELVGYNVIREYYVNDAGGQIDILIKSCFLRYLQALGNKKIIIPDGYYPGEYLKKIGLMLKKKFGNDLKKLEFDDYYSKIKPIILKFMITSINKDLEKLGIKFDLFISETDILNKGELAKVLDILSHKKLLYTGKLEKPKGKIDKDWEPRNQLLFKSTLFGDDRDRALKKSNGDWTYFASDIAYHYNKINRTKGNLINILGADHDGYTKRISSAVKAISEDKYYLTNKICSLVRLLEDGKIVKMSKRSGDFIKLSEIIKKIGKDVIRFIMLTRRNDQTLDFDFSKTKEKTKENPVFYVQYAYARCTSILNTFLEENLKIDYKFVKLLDNHDEIKMIKTIAQWPRVVENAASSMEPHRICFYLIELASEFHSFWNKGNENTNLRFINLNNLDKTKARMVLIKLIMHTLEEGFKILSIKPIREM